MSAVNNKNKGDFSKGSIPGHLMRLAVPVLLAELVHVLYNVVDRMFIGHIPGVGTQALSGVGVVFPIITFLSAFPSLFSYGGAPLCSIARGKGDIERASDILRTSMTCLISMGFILIGVMYLFMDKALLMMGANAETLTYAQDYFRIYLVGNVAAMISLGANAFINIQGFSVVGMCTVMIGAALNIVLDPIFIFTLGLGVKGAAIATVISQYASAIWVLLFLTGKKVPIRFSKFGIDVSILKQILTLGVTGFCFKITNSLTQALCNTTLSAFGGLMVTQYIGSISIINSIREIMGLPSTSITTSAQPIMGYNFGAKLYSRAKKTILVAFAMVATVCISMWLVVEFCTEPLVRIFTPDPVLIQTCVPCMKIFFMSFPFMSMQMTGQNTYVGLNCPKRALFFSLFRKVGLVVPLTIILPRVGFGVNGVFYAEAISQAIGGTLCFATMLYSVYRKLHRAKDGTDLVL